MHELRLSRRFAYEKKKQTAFFTLGVQCLVCCFCICDLRDYIPDLVEAGKFLSRYGLPVVILSISL